MATTDISLCNAALLMLGENTITSFDSDDNGAICSIIYPELRDGLLSIYPWSFVKVKGKLSRTTSTPTTTWKYQFLLPPDRLTAPWSVYSTDALNSPPLLQFDVMTDKLLANAEEIWIDYFSLPEESKWPPYFKLFFIHALAAMLAMPVTQDASLEQSYDQKAYGLPSDNRQGGFFGKATKIDSQITPSRILFSNPLAEARQS